MDERQCETSVGDKEINLGSVCKDSVRAVLDSAETEGVKDGAEKRLVQSRVHFVHVSNTRFCYWAGVKRIS